MQREWIATSRIRKEIELGPFVLMPNHLHAIVEINRTDDQVEDAVSSWVSPAGPRKASLGSLVAGFKAATTKMCRNNGWLAPEASLWQRNYFEHVVRNEDDYASIAQYITDNPRRWLEDNERPTLT